MQQELDQQPYILVFPSFPAFIRNKQLHQSITGKSKGNRASIQFRYKITFNILMDLYSSVCSQSNINIKQLVKNKFRILKQDLSNFKIIQCPRVCQKTQAECQKFEFSNPLNQNIKVIKGRLRRSIEHFLKNPIYEKSEISEIK